jgi:hypothetical protein
MEENTEPEESVLQCFSIRYQSDSGKADTSCRKITIIFNGPGTQSFEIPLALLTKVSTYFRDICSDKAFPNEASSTWDLCFGVPKSFTPPANEFELWNRFYSWSQKKCHIDFAPALGPSGDGDDEVEREDGVESLVYFVWFGIEYGIEEYQAQVLKALREDAG